MSIHGSRRRRTRIAGRFACALGCVLAFGGCSCSCERSAGPRASADGAPLATLPASADAGGPESPISLFRHGDTTLAVNALVAWADQPEASHQPALLMDPITEAEFAALGAAHMQRLEVMMEESKVLRQLAGAAVREARSLAPTDPARAAQLLDAVERAGFIHRTAGANKLTTMVGEAIEKQAQKARAEVLPGSGGA